MSNSFFDKNNEFERNLFLKKEVQELKEEIKRLRSNEELRAKDFEIGILKSDISELEDKIKRIRTEDQLSGKKKLKERIKNLQAELKRFMKENDNLKNEFKERELFNKKEIDYSALLKPVGEWEKKENK